MDKYLYALNADGSLKWRFQTESGAWSTPLIVSDGTICVGAGDNYLYALANDGSLKWKTETGGDVMSSATIGTDGTIYVGSMDGYFYAIYGLGQVANAPWPKFRYGRKNNGRVGGGF